MGEIVHARVKWLNKVFGFHKFNRVTSEIVLAAPLFLTADAGSCDGAT